MTIGDRIKHRRLDLGMSQDELAEKMGYKSRSTIAKIEKGVNDVAQANIVKFSEILHTSIAYLMGWDDEMEAHPIETAEKHAEMLKDQDFVDLYDDYRVLDTKERTIVKSLVKSLAETEKEA